MIRYEVDSPARLSLNEPQWRGLGGAKRAGAY